MTKWTIPKGRKPLTEADMAALTRRLADTAIEQSELYQAAKRDAEEAEAYAAELEATLMKALDALQLADDNLTNLQPKIAQLVPAPWTAVIDGYVDPVIKTARTTLAELTGGKDE